MSGGHFLTKLSPTRVTPMDRGRVPPRFRAIAGDRRDLAQWSGARICPPDPPGVGSRMVDFSPRGGFQDLAGNAAIWAGNGRIWTWTAAPGSTFHAGAIRQVKNGRDCRQTETNLEKIGRIAGKRKKILKI